MASVFTLAGPRSERGFALKDTGRRAVARRPKAWVLRFAPIFLHDDACLPKIDLEQVVALRAAGQGVRAIARALAVAPSSAPRECDI
ncbi:MAG TPA: hypothetical protein VFR38_16250 [Gaiellaceae bacterium]|nr:hypothetical protein [Gaiellaceae bacterium]